MARRLFMRATVVAVATISMLLAPVSRWPADGATADGATSGGASSETEPAIATVGGFGSRAGNIGVGFAIPMEQVQVTATQIVQNGEAQYPIIGADVNTGARRNGAQIVEVPSGTPASDAGLEEGDIVLAVVDTAVSDGISLLVAIRSHPPGETISLTVRRDGKDRTLRITLDGRVG